MYQNPANNNFLGDGGDNDGSGGVTKNNLQSRIMDQQQQNVDYNSMQQVTRQQQTSNSKTVRKKPYVKITEQPAGKALRFRYECEGRSAGSIPGANSTADNKTYPTIEIVGYKGRAVVVVSCVTKDPPYRPHPHNLVGKEGCKKGVCTLDISTDTMKAVFSNLGIQCVKKKNIESALRAREEIRVDPFKTGFAHRFQPSSIDLNSVRLCFQVFMEGDQKGCFKLPLAPVVSEPIYDKKAMSDLVICRLCSCSTTVLGNTQIILLCEKITKEDISVRFYEESNGQVIWEAFGEFQNTDVHKQTAIAFKTPRYRKTDITEPAKVFVQLKRPSDGITSEALPFEYIPLDSDPAHLKRKRQKTHGDPVHFLLQQHQNQHEIDHQGQVNISSWNTMNVTAIKMEPRDTSPRGYGTYRAQAELTPPSASKAVSPSGAYIQNTPLTYGISPLTGTQGDRQLLSPNRYNITHAVGGNKINPNAPSQMNINAYDQQAPQQHQPYHNNNFGSAGATHWDIKVNPASTAGNNNPNYTNPATMINIPTPVNSVGRPVYDASGAESGWNLMTNNFHAQHQQHLQQQQLQHHQRHQPVYDGVSAINSGVATTNNGAVYNATINATNINNGGNVNISEHGISNLLTFDSEQLVRMNTEDQQMLQLHPEDLQISNLSIST